MKVYVFYVNSCHIGLISRCNHGINLSVNQRPHGEPWVPIAVILFGRDDFLGEPDQNGNKISAGTWSPVAPELKPPVKLRATKSTTNSNSKQLRVGDSR